MEKRALAYSATLGLLLMATMWAMAQFILFREIPQLGASSMRTAILWGLCIATFACATAAGYLVMRKTPALIGRAAGKNPWRWMPLTWSARSIALAAAVMLACWVPYMVAQFPSGINFDTYVQIYQFLDPAPTYYDTTRAYFDAEYIDHHPVFDSLVFGAFFWLGDALGSQNLGLFTGALFQCLLGAGTLAASCCYLERLGVPKLFRVFSLAFCALFPFIPVWAMTLMKDPLHAPFFVGFLLCFFEAFRTRGEAWERRSWLVMLVVFGCLAALTKKTGLPVVIASLVILALYCRPALRWERALAALAVPIVYFGLFSGVICNAIGGVAPGGSQEGFGFAMQQVVTVVREGDDLTGAEREQVGRVLDLDEAVEGYSANSVDQVKNKAYASATRADYLEFVKAYISIGFRHPYEYLEACLNITAGFFCPGGMISHYGSGGPSKHFLGDYGPDLDEDGIVFDVYQPAIAKEANRAMNAAFDGIKETPFARFFFGRGLYGGWIPLTCLVTCLYCSRRYWVAFSPVLFSMALLLICPVVSARYMLMLLYACPLLLGITCGAFVERGRTGDGTGTGEASGDPAPERGA